MNTSASSSASSNGSTSAGSSASSNGSSSASSAASSDGEWERAFADDSDGLTSASSSASSDDDMGTTLEFPGQQQARQDAQMQLDAEYQQVLHSNNTAADGRRLYAHYPNLTNEEFFKLMGMNCVFRSF